MLLLSAGAWYAGRRWPRWGWTAAARRRVLPHCQALVCVVGPGHYAEGPPGDEKRPTPWPSHQRSPVALNLLPASPASRSIL